ncbi:MAG: YbaB/EbfC family nucleoid-associated protein [Halieaceae bacterium]|nr:YbaB/EbfC family nucleoid-associated protein [Halieaceae bacterium]
MKGSIGDLMKQAQQVQEKMEAAREKLANSEWEGQSGAGMVRVTMTGCYDVRRVKIDQLLMSEDREVLEDLLAAAVNDAVKKVEANSQQAMSGLASGFKLPFQL